MSVLATGGAGFIGAALVERLVAEVTVSRWWTAAREEMGAGSLARRRSRTPISAIFWQRRNRWRWCI